MENLRYMKSEVVIGLCEGGNNSCARLRLRVFPKKKTQNMDYRMQLRKSTEPRRYYVPPNFCLVTEYCGACGSCFGTYSDVEEG